MYGTDRVMSLADDIKQEVLSIVASNNTDTSNKDAMREIMHPLWREMRLKEKGFITSEGPRLINYFADGHEVTPEQISPRVYPAYDGELASLFRLSIMCWGVPATHGMGRQLPMVVMDESNHKIIGLLNLCDGPYTLDPRDKWIGWDSYTKAIKKQNMPLVSHASIVGAVPPYSKIIGGKLVASLLVSHEVRSLYYARHGVRPVLIGNTSALGRSSIYNRLSLFGRLLFIPVGYTKGYGRVLVGPELLSKMKKYLGEDRKDKLPQHSHYIIQAVCRKLGIPSIAKHGIARQVYVIPTAVNSRDVLRYDRSPEFMPYTETDIAQAALARWVVPRAMRDCSYKAWTLQDTWNLISDGLPSNRQLVLI